MRHGGALHGRRCKKCSRNAGVRECNGEVRSLLGQRTGSQVWDNPVHGLPRAPGHCPTPGTRVVQPARDAHTMMRRHLHSDLGWVVDASRDPRPKTQYRTQDPGPRDQGPRTPGQRPPEPATDQPTNDRRPTDRPTADPATRTTRASIPPRPRGHAKGVGSQPSLPNPDTSAKGWAHSLHSQPASGRLLRRVRRPWPVQAQTRPARAESGQGPPSRAV